jgi:adhesin/invasin
VTAVIRNAAGVPLAGDPVAFTTAGGLPCGTLNPSGATTNALGQAATTYTASITPGTCTVKATEAQSGSSASTTITQAGATPNFVAVSASSSAVPASGTSTSTVTATVTAPSGAAVSGDAVTFTTSGNPAGACGSLNPPSGSTNSSGQVTSVYISSTTVGFCTFTAVEASGGKGSATIVQTANPPAPLPNTVAVVANPAVIPANGTSTSAVTATVRNLNGVAVGGDPVAFVLRPTPICGGITPAGGISDASGQVVVTYIASANVGTCTITAMEAMTNNSGSTVITQTAPSNTITITANPSSIAANGTSVSTITVTVSNGAGVAVAGDPITLVQRGTPLAACGTLSPVALTTNSSGQATSAYISSTTTGFCTITATDPSGGQANVTITQHT